MNRSARAPFGVSSLDPPVGPPFRFPDGVCALLAGLVGFIVGPIATAATGDLTDIHKVNGGVLLFLLFAACVSSFFWVGASQWFRRRNISWLGAIMFGAFSPVIGLLPFSIFGAMLFLTNPGVAVFFGVVTGWGVRVIACSTKQGKSAA